MAKISGKLMSTKEVADLLGVPTQTIWNWVNNGVLKAFKSARNYMFFSRKYINTFVSKLEDLNEMETALDVHTKLVRDKIKEKELAFNALCNEIKGCNPYSFKRYAKIMSSIAHRLVDVGEVPLTANEHKLLDTLLSFGDTQKLAKELNLTQSRIGQMTNSLHLKLARLDAGNDKYSLLKAENARLRRLLIEATTNSKPKTDNDEVLATPIKKFGFTVRTSNALARLGVKTVGDLTMLSERNLHTAKGIGKVGLNEIRVKLRDFNIFLDKK